MNTIVRREAEFVRIAVNSKSFPKTVGLLPRKVRPIEQNGQSVMPLFGTLTHYDLQATCYGSELGRSADEDEKVGNWNINGYDSENREAA